MAEMRILTEADLRQIIALDTLKAWRAWRMLSGHSPVAVSAYRPFFGWISLQSVAKSM